MAYTINKYSGVQLIVLEDGTIDTSTSIGLVGRNYTGYGEVQNENFVHLLENFANSNPPARPIEGQLWFNTTNSLLHVWDDSKWVIVGSAVVSETAPEAPPAGALWYKMPYRTMYLWDGVEWKFIGPETAEGFGTTRARSTTLIDSDGNNNPVILIEVNGTILGIIASRAFTLAPATAPAGFGTLIAGINLLSLIDIKGNLQGRAESANRFENARLINGVGFDGTADVTIRSSTTNYLVRGEGLTGNDFDGSSPTTWAVDASSSNLIGKVVIRNSSGDFAAGTITANLVGNVQGNVTSTTGTSSFDVVSANRFVGATLTGNAFSATKLETARLINGVTFDGTSNVTVPAAANTLTGTVLAPNVTNSYLEHVGTLADLTVEAEGILIGSKLKLTATGMPTVRSESANTGLAIDVADTTRPSGFANVTLISSTISLAESGENKPALIPGFGNDTNLGHQTYRWKTVWANELKGNADTATLATRATNIVGGAAGAIPYQTASNTTTMLPLGNNGQYLRATSSGLVWSSLAFEKLRPGSYVSGSDYDTSVDRTWSVDATSANTANKVVARDASGDFYAGTISANLVGQVTGNASTATRLQTPRTINGVSFDGSANITVQATDPTRVAKTGDSMSGYLTLVGNPVSGLHAATKQYVDTFAQQFTFTYGNTIYSQSGYTNQVGSWNNGANYFDVFPPYGKSMNQLLAFIPSIAVIHYAGGVDGNDSLRCTWSNLGDRIRVYVQNTEQRSTPAANYLAIWS
jgi:hypothetical protein